MKFLASLLILSLMISSFGIVYAEYDSDYLTLKLKQFQYIVDKQGDFIKKFKMTIVDLKHKLGEKNEEVKNLNTELNELQLKNEKLKFKENNIVEQLISDLVEQDKEIQTLTSQLYHFTGKTYKSSIRDYSNPEPRDLISNVEYYSGIDVNYKGIIIELMTYGVSGQSTPRGESITVTLQHEDTLTDYLVTLHTRFNDPYSHNGKSEFLEGDLIEFFGTVDDEITITRSNSQIKVTTPLIQVENIVILENNINP